MYSITVSINLTFETCSLECNKIYIENNITWNINALLEKFNKSVNNNKCILYQWQMVAKGLQYNYKITKTD